MEHSKSLSIFSERLNDLMVENALNGEELSKRIGVPPSLVCRWRKPDTDKFLSSALKIANYFGCSLDYLFGREDDYYPSKSTTLPPFYEHLRGILKEKGITTYALFKNTKIKSSHLVGWKKGSEPKMTTLLALAEYLDCSLDVLVGRVS